ncbi:hypothetical protein BJ138DRAFT_638288 [Hygrophoropsis aurantiaca]|uniref:Uncharacterized protein n=1 Tax=Hygrophoropsis aurantiaca TaxID=72124 RepID=A0ACB8AJ17_9AGAM|nr:hypothetical protein BJ138DRAFT_638288 [Hygrophoropsis aurantiaca]
MGNHAGEQDIHNTIKIIEDEVLELEKEERDLLSRLRVLQDLIARQRARSGGLKNALIPVHRLPNEILQACFYQVVQSWDSDFKGGKFNWPCTPAFTISHVSRHWRQLAINMPSLWTNLIVTPSFGRHMDVFRDFLHRVNSMPIAADFRYFKRKETLDSTELSVMEAIMPLIQAHQIVALTLLNADPVYLFLQSRMARVEQSIIRPPSSTPFSRLTALTLQISSPETVQLTRLKSLLSATPQLKSLFLHHPRAFHFFQQADESIVNLPMLVTLTIIQCSRLMCRFLRSLSAPELLWLKIVLWDPRAAKSTLFIDDSPRFPKVEYLVLFSEYNNLAAVDNEIVSALPRVTHLTIQSPGFFNERREPPPPTFWPDLQHLTLDIPFRYATRDLRGCFTWLQKREDRANNPLKICVIDTSKEPPDHDADQLVFRYYEELQQYGNLAGSSLRLEEFLRRQAM